MSGHLLNISSTAGTLADQTRQLGEIRDGTSAIQGVRDGISDAGLAFREQLAHAEDTTAAMQRVVAAMKEVGALTKEIQEVGGEVKLIALNAQVMATRAGDAGSPLAVLARAMRELSADVQQQTLRIGEVMTDIAREAGALGEDELQDPFQTLTAETAVTAMLESLGRQHEALCHQVGVIDTNRTALRNEVMKLSHKLDTQSMATCRLREIEVVLDDLSSDAELCASDSALTNARAQVRDALSRYTMEHERTIHRTVTQTVSAAKGGGQRPILNQDLGSNVELF